MGRLRDDYEVSYIRDVSEEVIDLFGTDDVILYRFNPCDNAETRDPLYDEPTTTLKYRAYAIKALYLDWQDDFLSGSQGSEKNFSNKIYVSLNHLLAANVPISADKEYIEEGDIIELHHRGDKVIYDIIQVDREGYVNNSDKFVGYTLDVKRNSKFVPERKDIEIIGESYVP